MPTVAIQPTLRNTQAVGAALLHQFARERFAEAGLNEEFIQAAENMEEIDQLTVDLVPDESVLNMSRESSTSTLKNDSLGTTSMDQDTSQWTQNGHNNTTFGADQYHSTIGETTTEGETDNTVYHSMNAGRLRASSLDKMQSLPAMSTYGRELRKIADEFAKSRQRQILKEKANLVQLSDINKETFLLLLDELFKGGITRERIVALFFFCTDVALRAVSFAQELVVKLLGWSFSYIVNTVCRVVHELGGWDDILFRRLPVFLFNCCAILGVCILAVYLHRSLKA